MKPDSHRDHLLHDLVHTPSSDPDLTLPRRAARAARRWRRLRQGSAATGALAILIVAVRLGSTVSPAPTPAAFTPRPPRSVATAPAPQLEIIDDAGLYAALQGRSYLISSDAAGHLNVLFLDGADSGPTRPQS